MTGAFGSEECALSTGTSSEFAGLCSEAASAAFPQLLPSPVVVVVVEFSSLLSRDCLWESSSPLLVAAGGFSVDFTSISSPVSLLAATTSGELKLKVMISFSTLLLYARQPG